MLIRVKYLLILTISIQQRNKTKQARLSSLLLLSIGAAFITFASKTSIVSINYANANSSNLAGMKHLLCSYTRSNRRGGEVRFPREERRAAPASPFLDRFGDVWRGYLRKSSPFTSFSLTFGKLTTEFEMLFQFRKAESRRSFVAAYGKAVPSRFPHLRSESWP